jgi:hypothetical protein
MHRECRMRLAMFRAKKHYINSEKGIALVAALFFCLILMALGAVVITLSTGDIGTSSRLVGQKRALAAAEKGVARLTQKFDPYNRAASATNTYAEDLGVDTHSRYSISLPQPVSLNGELVEIHSMRGFDEKWGMAIYTANVTGRNTIDNTSVTVGVGFGHGPVDASTQYR